MNYSYEYNTYNGDIPDEMLGFMAVFYLIMLAVAVVSLIAEWKLFKKAGYNGWEAIVPFYNMYCLCDIVLGNGLLFLIMFVPFVNGLFSLFLLFKMAEVYNRSTAFGIGLVFLSPIFLCLMAFDSNTYYSGPSVKARQMGGYGSYGAGGYGGGYGAGNYGGVPNMTNDYQTYGSNNTGYQNNGFQAQGQPMQQNNGYQVQGQVQQNNGFQAQGQQVQQNNPFEKPGANNYYGNNNNYSNYNNQNGNGGF